jgi:two-component system, cell cycle sensor histidine kinase and response regulator CckA
MNHPLHVLIVEDSEDDMVLVLRELRRHGYDVDYQRVDTPGAMQAALARHPWDVVIADYTLPAFSGPAALKLLQQQCCDIPFIIVSGTIGEETAVAAMKAGAHDYLTKGNLARLVPAIEREMREAEERQRRSHAEQALRESEERFRQLAENISESVFWMADPGAGQFLYISPAYEKIWGRSSAAVAVQDWLETIHPEDRQSVQTAFFEQALAGTYDIEYRVVRPDGALRWIRDRGFPIRSPAGLPYRVVGIAEDMTDRKLVEAAFRRAQRLESLGTLASGIAHDFNNILTPILAAAQLISLKLAPLEPNAQTLLTLIEDSTKRGAALVKQILAFAKGVEGQRMPLEIRHVLLEVVQIIRQTFPKSITTEAKIDSPEIWSVMADATQLHQVFMNLCVNARDAMPQGGQIRLAIANTVVNETDARANPEARPGAYVVVTVTDTGTGILVEHLDRIFDPFFTTKEVGKGTGLGLSTVLGILRSHGGFITVSSDVGQGAAFKVFLPAVEAQAAKPNTTVKPLGGQGELILVVDDEVLIQHVAQTSLEEYNYRVLVASDGAEAIARYTEYQSQIHLVLMDLMMPGMDGITAIRELQHLNPQINVVVMSGMASPSQLAEIAEMGIQSFLPKPYTAQELLSTIRRTLATG